MVKALDVIKQLHAVMPTLNNYFTEQLSITSLTRSGTTVTAVTPVPHGLVTGRYVTILGALSPVLISSLTRVDNIATATTTTPHDLTGGWQSVAKISGADQADYNGDKELIERLSAYKFTFKVQNEPVTPATGTIYLQEQRAQGYNGRHLVTVVDPTTFTYQITQTPLSPAQGTIVARKGIRISGGATIERCLEAYTKQVSSALWGFVVLDDVVTSKDRRTSSDATSTLQNQNDYRLREIYPFSVYVVAPANSKYAALTIRDSMSDIAADLYKSILGVSFPSTLSNNQNFQVVPVSNGVSLYNGAIYVHRFNFEASNDVTYCDIVDPDYTVAFRNVHIDFLDFTSEPVNTIMQADFSLEKE